MGANTGINVLYSGTVAGAIEGAFFGLTSVAVSLSLDTQPDYNRAARMSVALIEQLLRRSPPAGSLWNLNLPATRDGWPLGVKTVPMGLKRHVDVVEKRIDPRGRPYYWTGLDPMEDHQMEPGTDVRELADGYATITPLRFDLTDASTIERLRVETWAVPARD
jgi:5'-nucleotidase